MTISATPDSASGPLARLGALVTGGSCGIGRAIAARLAADSAAVVVTYDVDRAAADALVPEVTKRGGFAQALRLDVTDPDQFAGVFTQAEHAFAEAGVDGLNILVANAGVFASTSLDVLSVEEWDRVMAINGRGTFLTIRHAAERIRNSGRVITVSTIGTAWPSPGEAAYAASKAAAEQVTRVASRELGRRGITANTISLGPTDTDFLRNSAPAEALDGAAAMTALGRIAQPADLAALLARPDSRWITGQNIHADGGLT